MPNWSRSRFSDWSTRFTLRAIVRLRYGSAGLQVGLIRRNGDVLGIIVEFGSNHAALLDDRPERFRIATTLPRLPRAFVVRRDAVALEVVRPLDEVPRAFVRRELWALERLRFALERVRLDAPRFDLEVARVPLERLLRADVVRVEREVELAVRPRPVDFRAVARRPEEAVRELFPRVDVLRAPVEREDVPRVVPALRREPLPRVRELELRAREPAEGAEVRRAPAVRPEDLRPLSLRRLALLSPCSRACAVSRAISLLKLLVCPPAVVS